MLQALKCLLDGLQDFVEEIKYRYKVKPMLHKGPENVLKCTIQLTVFADGKTLPPLITFRGQGLRINAAEKKEWTRRFNVVSHPKV